MAKTALGNLAGILGGPAPAASAPAPLESEALPTAAAIPANRPVRAPRTPRATSGGVRHTKAQKNPSQGDSRPETGDGKPTTVYLRSDDMRRARAVVRSLEDDGTVSGRLGRTLAIRVGLVLLERAFADDPDSVTELAREIADGRL